LGPGSLQSLPRHAQVYCAAEFYAIDRLRPLALLNLETAIEEYWDADVFTALLGIECVARDNRQLFRQISKLSRLGAKIAATHMVELFHHDEFVRLYLPTMFTEDLVDALAIHPDPQRSSARDGAQPPQQASGVSRAQHTSSGSLRLSASQAEVEKLKNKVKELNNQVAGKKKAIKEAKALQKNFQAMVDRINSKGSGSLCNDCPAKTKMGTNTINIDPNLGMGKVQIVCQGCWKVLF